MERIRYLDIFGALGGSARIVCVAAIAAALLLGVARVSTASAPAGVKVYEPNPDNPGVVAGVFDKCGHVQHRGHSLVLHARSTNGGWDLTVALNPWRGFRHRYVFHYGSAHPGLVAVETPSGHAFSTAFTPPRGAHLITYIAGALQFHNAGATVSLSADPNNNAYDAFARVDGTMRCIGRR